MQRHTMRLLVVALLAILCSTLVLSVTSPVARADTNPMRVTAHDATVHFSNSIDFSVTVTDSSATITSASIDVAYVMGGIYGGSQSSNHNVTIAQPAQTVTLHDSENIALNSFVPVGTPVDYTWTFQDSAGHSFTDATQHITVTDTRFPWQTLSQGMVIVHWYNQPPSFGQGILQLAVQHLARISQHLGATPTAPLTIWIYASHNDFFSAIEPYSNEWVGGIAYPQYSEALFVIADLQDPALNRDMPHEMTHLVFAQLESSAMTIPTWFNEGLAVYNQAYHEPAMTALFQQALTSHTLIPLKNITGSFPSDSQQAYLAYAQSWHLVEYMYQTFGQAKMTAFLQALNSPLTDFDTAAKQALGVDSQQLEKQWLTSLGQPIAATSPTTQKTPATASNTSSDAFAQTNLLLIGGTLTLGGGALLAIILVLVTMRRRKRWEQHMSHESAASDSAASLVEQEPQSPLGS